MFVVDTNILIYGADRRCPEHERCRRLILDWRRRSEPWYLTWGIIYEFLRVSTHPNVFRKPFGLRDAWAYLEAILRSPSLAILNETDRHGEVMTDVFREVSDLRGNLVFDAHTAVLMKEHGVRRIYTRDTDFHRFPFLEVIDPLQ